VVRKQMTCMRATHPRTADRVIRLAEFGPKPNAILAQDKHLA
jgi:hypothetical protein